MLDESAGLVRDGGQSSDKAPMLVTWHTPDRGSSQVTHATEDPRLLGRRASATEILVAIGIVLFALIFICKARGAEYSPAPPEAQHHEIVMRSMIWPHPGGSPAI